MPGDTNPTGPNQSPETGKFRMRPEIASAMRSRLVWLPQALEVAQAPKALALEEEQRAQQQAGVLEFAPKQFPFGTADADERRAA